MNTTKVKLPLKEAQLEAQMEAVENSQRIIRNTEAQVSQVKVWLKGGQR